MNSKELEALVLKQGEEIERARTWAVEALENTRTLNELALKQAEIITAAEERAVELAAQIAQEMVEVNQLISKLQAWIGADQDDGPFYPEFKALTARTEVLEKLVLARNASAPTKRNMTDEDALRVMTGDLKDLAHKDAAEKIGLTYAQVYSCRLEFTFKHVHKNLRDGATSDAPWSNPWSK